jgi:hypothetical protein
MTRAGYIAATILISFAALAQTADDVISTLKTTSDPVVRAKVIVGLAEWTPAQLSLQSQTEITKLLLSWYASDPHANVHSAIDYLFRYDSTGERPRKIVWGQSNTLHLIEERAAGKTREKFEWYVTRIGAMSIIRGPISFNMGSPEEEADRSGDETLHPVTIPRTFAIGTHEVTVDQFQRFLDANPEIRKNASADPDRSPARNGKRVQQFSPYGACPQISMTWYEAAMFCNWLSKEEGISKDQWCYPKNFGPGMALPMDYLHRTGYRLPTEAEW